MRRPSTRKLKRKKINLWQMNDRLMAEKALRKQALQLLRPIYRKIKSFRKKNPFVNRQLPYRAVRGRAIDKIDVNLWS